MGKPTLDTLWARCLARKPRNMALTLSQIDARNALVSLMRPDEAGHATPVIHFRDDPIRALEKMERWLIHGDIG